MLCNVLLCLCLSANAVRADDFDGKSMLFARLGAQTQQGLPQRPVFRHLGADGIHQAGDLQTPLGSVWKLFVFAYAIDKALPLPDYVCSGNRQVAEEESYCCDRGRSISADAALAQSC